jgi:hypothetical protein
VNYYAFKSILAARKQTFSIHSPSESFDIAPKRAMPYIEPSLTKIEFADEKPTVILVSAVGATGKSTLAQVLSSELGLPVLDLNKHKPVGDNTLSGLLTNSFRVEDLTSIFDGLRKGTYGLIIDGIDEGRSKTTEKGFEAFLDDIIRPCTSGSGTSFVMLGRTQVLDDCWLYFAEKGISPGLITIDPFDVDSARRYIDAFTNGVNSNYAVEYAEVRDNILAKLSAAFNPKGDRGDATFLSFIGYPPVLDAIVTLLTLEPNYHRINQELRGADGGDVEVNLLYRIGTYILDREKDQKVIPNIVRILIEDLSEADRTSITKTVFDAQEQCIRLLAHSLQQPLSLASIGAPAINEQYERQLLQWLPEHPFLNGRRFRNAIFECIALAIVMASLDPQAVQLSLDYLEANKHNYYLIYFLDRIATEKKIPLSCIRAVTSAALEFRSATTSIELNVFDAGVPPGEACEYRGVVETEIDLLTTEGSEVYRSFAFRSDVNGSSTLDLGRRLSATYISVPCSVVFSGPQELEFTAPIEVSAPIIALRAPSVILRHSGRGTDEDHIAFDAARVECAATSILTSGVEFRVSVNDKTGLAYPLIKYVETREPLPTDPALKEKYLRLKRILVLFRSHSKGTLAKYKHKIEHVRVLGNDNGPAILERLLRDKVLTLSGNFYFLQPDHVDSHLGVSWSDLRKGHTSTKLLDYLRSISGKESS